MDPPWGPHPLVDTAVAGYAFSLAHPHLFRVWVKSGPAVSDLKELPASITAVLAKDPAARRVLDQGQGPSGLLEAGKPRTYPKYEHTIDK